MEHIVFFPGPDGAAAFRRLPSLDEAVRFVEHLRNAEGVDHVSCHALVDVPLAFRAYYRVEVETGAEAVESAPAVEAVTVDESQPMPGGAAEPGLEPVSVGANGHRVEGANSLGFFA